MLDINLSYFVIEIVFQPHPLILPPYKERGRCDFEGAPLFQFPLSGSLLLRDK